MLQRFGETLPEREVKFAPVDLKSVEADGTFSGYASLFGTVDLGQDLVMPGAFRESLASRGARGVKLLFQHDPNEPIGVWLELNEDARGAELDARWRAGRAVHRLPHAAGPHGPGIGRAPTRQDRSVGDLGGDLPHAARGAGLDSETARSPETCAR